MRTNLIFLFAILFIQCSSGTKLADFYNSYDQKDYLYWSENRKLKWEDFQSPVSSHNSSEIYVINPAVINKKQLFTKTNITIICAFDKNRSWVNINNKSEALLLYNQVIFNIYELYTRKLRQKTEDIDFGLDSNLRLFPKMVGDNKTELLDKVDQFKIITNYGKEVKIIEEWFHEINTKLDELITYRILYDSKNIHSK